jgi:hypothetical protein
MVSVILRYALCCGRHLPSVLPLLTSDDLHSHSLCSVVQCCHSFPFSEEESSICDPFLQLSDGFGLFAEYNVTLLRFDGSWSVGIRLKCQNLSSSIWLSGGFMIYNESLFTYTLNIYIKHIL